MVKFSVNNSTSFAMMMLGREDVLKAAKILDESGVYNMLSIMDHINWYPDYAKIYAAWIMATEIAMTTSNIEIGIMVADVFRVHPVTMAHQAMHLQQVSNGRFNLGLGAGEGPNLQAYGINADKPVSHLEEAIQVIKLLFESNPKNKVSFEGKYYNFKKQYLQFPDFKFPVPKVWMGAQSPRTLKIAAKYADGWLPMGCTPKYYKEMAEVIKSEGRQIEMGYNTFIGISETDPEKAKSDASMAASVTICRPEIMKDINVELPEKLDFVKHYSMTSVSEHKRHLGNAMAFCQENVPESVRMDTVLAGTPDEVIAQIEKFVEAGVENIGLQFMGSDYWGSLNLFTEKVIPYFKN